MEWLWTALFGLIGVIIGCIATTCIGTRSTWNQTVSQRRVEWLRQMSEDIGVILSVIRMVKNVKDTKEKNILVEKYFYAKYHLLAQLNVKEKEPGELEVKLHELDDLVVGNKQCDFDNICNAIVALVRKIEKTELVKVKQEAKGQIT